MASKIKDIIEIGEGWACALKSQKSNPVFRCYHKQKLITELPLASIMQCAPVHHTALKEKKVPPNGSFSIKQVPEPKSLKKVAELLNNLLRKTTQPSSTLVVTVDYDAPSLVIAVGGSSRYSYDDPELGNMLATTEAAQNMACTGASPVAFFKLPPTTNQCPVPTLGLVGLLPRKVPQIGPSFRKKGDMIYLLGFSVEDIASSEYLYSFHHIHPSPAPWVNAKEQSRMQSLLTEAIHRNLLSSVNSITKGGLFISLVESSMQNQLGFDVTTDAEIREDAFLFGESLGRFVVSTSEQNDAAFVDMMTQNKIPLTTLGHTTKGEIRVDDISYGFIQDFA